MPSYKNQPFITGSYDPHNVKTEILDIDEMKWNEVADYPFYSGSDSP